METAKRGRPAIYRHPVIGNVKSRATRVAVVFDDQFLQQLFLFCAERSPMRKPISFAKLVNWVKVAVEAKQAVEMPTEGIYTIKVTKDQIDVANMRSLGWIAWTLGVKDTASEVRAQDKEEILGKVYGMLGVK
jgi:hypothetical protein